MEQRVDQGRIYVCPMHSRIRQVGPGKCPTCGMDLVPEGTRFGLFRHIISSPVHVVLMTAVAVAIVAAVMLAR